MNKIVAPLVAKYTSQYIEGIDESNLNMSVFSGSIELSNLKLKRCALAQLELPVDVIRGTLSKLVIKVPWTSLGTEPVVVKIDELLLLAKPKTFGTRVKYVRLTPKKKRGAGSDGLYHLGGLQLLGERDEVLTLVGARTANGRKYTDVSKHLVGDDGAWQPAAEWTGSSHDSIVVELRDAATVEGYRVRSGSGPADLDVAEWVLEGGLSDDAAAPWTTLHKAERGTVEVPRERLVWTRAIRDMATQDATEQREAKLKQTREALDANDAVVKQRIELDKGTGGAGGKDEAKAASFTEKLQETVVSNLEIDISSIHVRFEDDVTSPGDVYTMGAHLESLKVFSTASDWKRAFVKELGAMVYKGMHLENMGVYMDHSRVLTHALPDDKWHELMIDSLSRRHTYLLSPLSLNLHLAMVSSKGKRKKLAAPGIAVSVSSSSLALGVNRSQIVSALKVTQFLQRYVHVAQYRQYRPNMPVLENKKAWWHFVKRCLLRTIRETRKQTDKTFEGKKKLMEEYVEFYKRTQSLPWLPAVEKGSAEEKRCRRYLDAYEYHLPLEALQSFREEAHTQIAAGRTLYEERQKAMNQKIAEKKKQQGWGSWLYGTKVDVSKEEAEMEQGLVSIDDAARLQLKESIGWTADDDETADEAESPLDSEHVNVVFNLDVERTSITLNESRKEGIAAVVFDGMALTVRMREGGLSTELALQDFSVTDCGAAAGAEASKIVQVREGKGALLDIVFDMPPANGKADQALVLKGRGLDVVFSKPWLQRIVALVQIPPDVNLSSLEAATSVALAEIGSGATRGLMMALEERKSIALDIKVEGPKILVPFTGADGAGAFLELNLGNLAFESDVDKKRQDCILRGAAADLQESDYYDRFHFKLQGLNAMIYAAAAPSDKQFLISDVEAGLLLENCLTPGDHERPSTVITGDVGSIGVSVSHQKLCSLLTAVEVVTSWIGNMSGTEMDESVDDVWQGVVQALPPKFAAEAEGEALAVREEWAEYDATYLPSAYKLVLKGKKGDELPLVVRVGPATDVQVSGDVLHLTLPQKRIGEDAHISLRVRVKDAARREALFELVRKSRWAQTAWRHDRELNAAKYSQAKQSAKKIQEELSSDVPATKVSLRAAFCLASVSLDLYRNDGTHVSKIGINSLQLAFEQRQKDMRLDLSLATLCMLDMLRTQAPGADEPIFVGLLSDSKRTFEENQGEKSVVFSYCAAEEGSPMEFRAKGTAAMVTLNCGHVMVDCERTSLPLLLGYLTRFSDVAPSKIDSIVYEETRAKKPKEVVAKNEGAAAGDVAVVATEPATEVALEMKGFQARFRNDGDVVFSMVSTASNVGVKMVPEESLRFTAQLANYSMQYHAGDAAKFYPHIVECCEDESALSVDFSQDYSVPSADQAEVPRYTAACVVRLGRCKIFYLQRTVGHLVRYFDVGYIMGDMSSSSAVVGYAADAAYAGALAAQNMATQAAEARMQSLSLMQFDILVDKPTLIVPYTATSSDHVEATLGTLVFKTSLLAKEDAAWVEVLDIQLKDTDLYFHDTEMEKHAKDCSIIEDWDVRCLGERMVVDPKKTLPGMKLRSEVGDIKISLTKSQYEALMLVLNANVLDTWLDESMQVDTQAPAAASQQPQAKKADEPKKEEKHVDPVPAADSAGTSLEFDLDFKQLTLVLQIDKRGDTYGEPEPLMLAFLKGLTLSHEQKNNGDQLTNIGLASIGVTDTRYSASEYANQLLSYGEAATAASAEPLLRRTLTAEKETIAMALPAATVTLLPELLGSLLGFVTSDVNAQYVRTRRALMQERVDAAAKGGDRFLLTTAWLDVEEDWYLGPTHRLIVRAEVEEQTGARGRVVVDMHGKDLFLTGACNCADDDQPTFDTQAACIAVAKNTTLVLRNTTVHCLRALEDYVLPGGGNVVLDRSELRSPATVAKAEREAKAAAAATEGVMLPEEKERMVTATLADGLRVYVPEDTRDEDSRVHIVVLQGSLTLAANLDGPGTTFFRFDGTNIAIIPATLGGAEVPHSHNVFGPAELQMIYRVRPGLEEADPLEQDVSLECRNFVIRVSYNDLNLLLKAWDGVSTHILGGEEAAAAAKAEKPLVMFDPNEMSAGVAAAAAEAPVAAASTETAIRMRVDTLEMMIVDDQKGFDTQLLRLGFEKQENTPYALLCEGKQLVTNGAASLETQMSVIAYLDYLNPTNLTWEPVMERHDSFISLSQTPTGHGSAETLLKLQGKDLAINVSNEVLAHLLKVSDDWSKGLAAGGNAPSSPLTSIASFKRERQCRYVVENQTGMTVSIRGDFTPDAIDLKSTPFAFDVEDSSEALCVDFAECGMRPLKMLESEPHQVFQFPHSMIRQEERLVYATTLKREAQLHMTLSSRFVVVNLTSLPLEMRIDNAVIPLPSTTQGGNEVGIPIWALQRIESGFCVRSALPEHADYRWSVTGATQVLPIRGNDALPTGVMSCGYQGKDKARDSTVTFSYTRKVRTTSAARTSAQLRVIEIQAPLLVENLLPVPTTVALSSKHWQKRGIDLQPGEAREVFGVSADDDLWATFVVLAPETGQDFAASEPLHFQNPAQPPADKEHTLNLRDNASGRTCHLLAVWNVTDQEASGNTTESLRAKAELSVFVPYWLVNLTSEDLFCVRDQNNRVISNGLVRKDDTAERAPPMLFSSTDRDDPFSGKLSVGTVTNPGYFSKPFSYDVVGVPGEVRVPDAGCEKRFGVSIELAPGQFSRSKIIKLTNRWVFKNTSDRPLEVIRGPLRKVLVPGAEDTHPTFHPAKNGEDEFMDVRMCGPDYDGTAWESCDNLKFTDLGTHSVIMKHRVLGVHVFDCQVTQLGSVNYVVFKEASAPPLRIVNNTFSHISFGERNDGAQPFVLVGPFETVPYYPKKVGGKAPVLRAQHDAGGRVDFCADIVLEIGPKEYHGCPGDYVAHIELGDDAMLLVVEHSTMRRDSATKDNLGSLSLQVNTNIGLSMIAGAGAARYELAYLYLGGVSLFLKNRLGEMDLQLCVNLIQMDNQLYGGQFPVLLTSNIGGGVKTSSSRKDGEKLDAMVLSVQNFTQRIGGLMTMSHMSFLLQELEVMVDDNFLYALLNYSNALFDTPAVDAKEALQTGINYVPVYDEDLHGGIASTLLYAGEFILNPMKFTLTFKADEEGSTGRNVAKNALTTLTMAVTNIEEGQLKLSALALTPAHGKRSDVIDVVFQHYTSCVLKGLFKIIGALEFLGNPVGLVDNLGEGFSDLFYEPLNGITKSPKDFAQGIGRGVSSFGRHTAFGLLGSVGGITTSISKGVANLSMDDEFIRERRKRQRTKATGVVSGIEQGAMSIGGGIIGGISGLVLRPVEV